MKFSLFYEMQISRPTPETEARLFSDALEQAELAVRGYIPQHERRGSIPSKRYVMSSSSAQYGQPQVWISCPASVTLTARPRRKRHDSRCAREWAISLSFNS